MSDLNPLPPGDLSALEISIQRVADKLSLIAEAVKKMTADRIQLENKIDDAQKRVQRILSRLPDQSDGRQLNLLGEVATPNNPEDDNEPTTH
jgi:predicted  nucleic acid-binding Zn-ribbon protein